MAKKKNADGTTTHWDKNGYAGKTPSKRSRNPKVMDGIIPPGHESPYSGKLNSANTPEADSPEEYAALLAALKAQKNLARENSSDDSPPPSHSGGAAVKPKKSKEDVVNLRLVSDAALGGRAGDPSRIGGNYENTGGVRKESEETQGAPLPSPPPLKTATKAQSRGPTTSRWPTRSEWLQAARETNLSEDLLPVAKKTYNAKFIREWERLSSSATPLPPEERHREAEAVARAAIRGATAVPAGQINAGMTVRSTSLRGYGEQRVAQVFTDTEGRYAVQLSAGAWQSGPNINENHPDAQYIYRRNFRFANGHTLEFIDDRNRVIHFPGLD